MPAPKGNKYGKGNPNSGRPPKYNLEAEGKELLEWSKISSSTSFYQFTREKDYSCQDLYDFAQRSEAFRENMEKARENIGQNREEQMCDGLMHPRAWERWAPVYHRALDKYEDDVEERKHQRNLQRIEFEINKKKEAGQLVDENILEKFDQTMSQISKMQKES